MQVASVGIDLGKTTFHLVALDDHGNIVIKKKFSRKQLLAYTANVGAALVGIEACSGAHFIGATLRDQGHEVRLIPAQFVKPFLKSNKNDFLDAEVIAEAVARKNTTRSADSSWSVASRSPKGRRTCASRCPPCWKTPTRTSRPACAACSIISGKSGRS